MLGKRQVHGHRGELQAVAALQEQNVVVLGNAHKVAQVGFGSVDDALEGGGAMAHFHH